jgi:hypothetical protein
LSVHRSPLGILPFLAVLSVEPENMSTYVIVEEPGDWPCHADYLLTARTYLQHGLPTTGASAHHQPLPQPGTPGGRLLLLPAGPGPRPPLPAGLQAISQAAAPASRQAGRKLQGWLAQQSEDRIRVRAIFGQCEQSELAGLARYYYGLSQLPLQELTLKRGRHGWSVRQQESLSPLALSPSEKALMVQHAQALVGTGDEEQAAPLPARHPGRPQRRPRQQRCSGAGAFIKAAAAQDPGRDPAPSAIERLPEFDTLWLRAETAVGHYTFEFARRAEQLKMPVIDSSRAILACSNKLYLYELMVRSGVPMPPPPS